MSTVNTMAFDMLEESNAKLLKLFDEMSDILKPHLSRVGTRVLVCDDNENIRAVLKVTLEKMGYEVMEAVNGEDCLNKIKGNNVGLVLLDMNMPKMNGKDVLKYIGGAKFKTIVISAIPEDDAAELSKTMGVPVYTKPFKLADIRQAVCQALPQRKE